MHNTWKMLLFYKVGLCEFSALEIKNATDSFKTVVGKGGGGGVGLFIRVLQASTHCSESVENSML